MVHISVIQAQLTQLGIRLSHWFMPEVKELQHILMDNEKIIAASPGRYFSGFALLVATDQRLLLIDKRAFFMNVEDTRYDMISEINFSTRIYDATMHIFTLNKQHNFTSFKYRKQLRELTNYVQQRVWELRQNNNQPNTAPMPIQALVNPVPEPQQHVAAIIHRLPRPHMPRLVGSAAMDGSRRYSPNPYMPQRSNNL